jgi:SAM-dependent methyltransferase
MAAGRPTHRVNSASSVPGSSGMKEKPRLTVVQWVKSLRYLFMSNRSIFADIYKRGLFLGDESQSGPGSTVLVTAHLRRGLRAILTEFNVQSMLDVPCGDFTWMRYVDFDKCQYIGADIVENMILDNSSKFGHVNNRTFIVLDITTDMIPMVDLVFCRDLLVHLSLNDARRAIRNVKESYSKYICITTFPGIGRNDDTLITGKWRPINLQIAPFNFPEPLRLLNDSDAAPNGKTMGLWEVRNIPT